ncbi:MAG: PHP domain-containing protein [Lentimicrobium sp.]|nr:PHP domain-containing protein [Lentimicrobium sp.]
MKEYKADLHIHTVLSPCGSLEMSPRTIIQEALKKNINIIGITDHNSTRQCREVSREAQKAGITVFAGVEVTSKEEVHCLAFFETFDILDSFQQYLDLHLPDILNDIDLFGYQVVVDELENIVYEEPKLLISALTQSIDQVEAEVHRLKGIFIPAHINRPKYSLISQLGFVPPDLRADAFELSKHISKEEFIKQFGYLGNRTFISNSDAHQPDLIGENFTILQMESPSFDEFRQAIAGTNGRRVMI